MMSAQERKYLRFSPDFWHLKLKALSPPPLFQLTRRKNVSLMAGRNLYDTQRYSYIYIHIYTCEPLQSIPTKLPSNGEEKHSMPWDKGSMAFATSAYPKLRQRYFAEWHWNTHKTSALSNRPLLIITSLRVQESQDPGLDRYTDASNRHQSN